MQCYSRSDVVERSLLRGVLLLEEVVEDSVGAVGSVVDTKTPGLGLGKGGNVGGKTSVRLGGGAASLGPPGKGVSRSVCIMIGRAMGTTVHTNFAIAAVYSA